MFLTGLVSSIIKNRHKKLPAAEAAGNRTWWRLKFTPSIIEQGGLGGKCASYKLLYSAYRQKPVTDRSPCTKSDA